MKIRLIAAALVALAATACQRTVTDATDVAEMPPIFPDYTEVTIPAEIAPLNFGIDGDADCVDVVVRGSLGGEMHVQGSRAAFDIDRWHSLTEANKGGQLTFTVCVERDGRWTRYADFNIYVSKYALDDYGLTYRRIAPGYEVYSHMGIYERNLRSFDERALIENTQVPGMCINCHATNRTRPEQSLFHVRGDHGATVVANGNRTDVLQAVNDSLGGSMVYPYWHPSGKYCAFSTNMTRQGFHMVKDERLEVFDLKSDVFVYDIEKREIILDSLLSKKDYSENVPVFSPDGRKMYFTTALQREYPLAFREQRYNLCSIDFDADRGTFGTTVDTIFNAEQQGKSLTWPRPSYDGRYIMAAVCDYGYFSIWHSESDLWLIDTATGQMHPLTEANSAGAESFPNWSGDSHWFVFTSRRIDGLYSSLYLACIDDEGRATKAFMLPQEDPQKYYSSTLYSFNTPCFVSRPTEIDSRALSFRLESAERVATQVR